MLGLPQPEPGIAAQWDDMDRTTQALWFAILIIIIVGVIGQMAEAFYATGLFGPSATGFHVANLERLLSKGQQLWGYMPN